MKLIGANMLLIVEEKDAEYVRQTLGSAFTNLVSFFQKRGMDVTANALLDVWSCDDPVENPTLVRRKELV